MSTALDTDIISGLLRTTSKTSKILLHLAESNRQGALLIGPAVYAESLANPNLPSQVLKQFLSKTGIQVEFALDESIWTLAGERYARYAARRRQSSGESPRRLLADFLIGAHALARADCLMTYDTKVYRQDFPELSLYPLPGL